MTATRTQFSRLYWWFLVSIAILFIPNGNCQSADDKDPSVRGRSLHPSFGSTLTRPQFLDIPAVSAVVLAISFLLLLLPLRILRFSPNRIQANRRKDSSVSTSLMEEAAQLTRKIIDAIEGEGVCVNQIACNFSAAVKKLGSRQEIVLSMLEILLPERWKASVTLMREAVVAKKPHEFCLQFSCESNEVNPVQKTDPPFEEPSQTTPLDWVTANK